MNEKRKNTTNKKSKNYSKKKLNKNKQKHEKKSKRKRKILKINDNSNFQNSMEFGIVLYEKHFVFWNKKITSVKILEIDKITKINCPNQKNEKPKKCMYFLRSKK